MASIQSCINRIHWDQLKVALYKVPLSVTGSSGAQWVTPLFARQQEVTGPVGINMSHKQMTGLYCGGGWAADGNGKASARLLSDSDVLMYSTSVMPMRWMYDWSGSTSPWTHKAKVTFESLFFNTVLYMTAQCKNNGHCPEHICVLQIRVDHPQLLLFFFCHRNLVYFFRNMCFIVSCVLLLCALNMESYC